MAAPMMQSSRHASDFAMAGYSAMYAAQVRYPTVASNRTCSGRVEKPRSQHSSPANERRRGYPMLRHSTPAQQHNSSHAHFLPQRRSSRPYSWSSAASSAIGASGADYMISPAVSAYTATPAFHYSTQTQYQYPSMPTANMQRMYSDIVDLKHAAHRASSTISSSSCYSNPSLSPPSPVWHHAKPDSIMPALTTASSIYSSPEHDGPWTLQHSTQSRTQTHASPPPPPPPPYAASHRPQQSPADMPFISYHPAAADLLLPLTRPPSTDLLWPSKEDDGEVLVALGLYDAPGAFDSPAAAPRKLKLAETWQPPVVAAVAVARGKSTAGKEKGVVEEEADVEEDEDDDEEIAFPRPEPGTSWFMP